MELDTILPHDDSHTHPSDQHQHQPSHPFHRKIELQSLHDLTYLQRNLQRSAHDRLNLHFPRDASISTTRTPRRVARPATHIPLDGGSIAVDDGAPPQDGQSLAESEEGTEDPMRAQVSALVAAFLNETWSHASHSLSINGLDATDLPQFSPPQAQAQSQLQHHRQAPNPAVSVEEIEGLDYTLTPFDTTLSSRVASLHAELESLTASVAKLRRDAPARAAQTYGESLETVMAIDAGRQDGMRDGWRIVQDYEREKREKREKGETDDAEAPLMIGQGMDERWNEDVRRTYEGGVTEVSGLAGVSGAGTTKKQDLNRSLTSTVGKVRRAVGVMGELVE